MDILHIRLSLIGVVTAALLGSAGIAAAQQCAQPVSEGSIPTVIDCLHIAKASVRNAPCAPCVCDVDGSGEVRIRDALRCLLVALGASDELACPPCDSTTTTLESCASCGDALVGLAQREDLCEADQVLYDELHGCICSCCEFLCPEVEPVGSDGGGDTGASCLACFRDNCRSTLESCWER